MDHLKLPSSSSTRAHERKVSHVDIIEAVTALNGSHGSHEKSYSRYSSHYSTRSYGEDIADRNIGSLYSSSPSSIPLAASNSTSSLPRSSSDHPHTLPPLTMSLPREILFVAIICQAQLLTQGALAQTIAPLPLIISTFYTASAPSSSLAWYSASFALTAGTFILPAGRFGDVYGHRLLFAIGWLQFGLFSVLAGFSSHINSAGGNGEIFLVVCRALQGIGPALVVPNGLALLGTTYPPGKKKNMLFALFGACAPAGFVISATFSSLLSEKVHWSWAFWVLGIDCFLIFGLTLLVIPSAAATHNPSIPPITGRLFQRLKQSSAILDLPGAALGVTALVLLNISLNQAPLVGWDVPYTYFMLVIAVLFLAAFFYWQTRATYPLIPLPALNRDTLFVLACIACGWASMGIWIFYTWAYMGSLIGLSGLQGCVWFAPAPVAGFVASAATGLMLSRFRPQWIMLISMCAFFGGTVVMATVVPERSFWLGVFWSVVVMPFGMDMSFPSATLLVSDAAGPGSQGMAASLVNTVVNYSISIGLGLAGTVVREVGADGDVGEIGPGEVLRGYRSAWFLGMGLSGAGILVAVVFCGLGVWDNRRGNGARSREKI